MELMMVKFVEFCRILKRLQPVPFASQASLREHRVTRELVAQLKGMY